MTTYKKTWLITGAGRGMGVDFAKAALAAGHNVVGSGRNPDTVAAAIGESDDLLVVKLDVTSSHDAETATTAAVNRFGAIDVLVNNAGNNCAGYFEELTPEQIERQLTVNLFGPMNVTRAVLPVMRKQRSGHVVTISSTAGFAGYEGGTAYATSKFAVDGWMESPQTRKLMDEAHGGVLPRFTHNYDPFVALTYAAAATRTLRLGTGVCLVPEREPIAIAKALASLDVLSDGRVLFGVGVGWIPEELVNHGIDPPTRWAVMDERIGAMRAIWTQDEAEYHGRHVDFGPIWSWPKPTQRPHAPILVGGDSKGVIRRVLAYGDEWMPHAGMPVEELGARIQELQHAASAAGRGADIPVTVQGAESDDRALNELREVGVTRATLYAPSADADQVLRFDDDIAPLVDATNAT